MSKRIDLNHRRYRIIAAEVKGSPVAAVFQGPSKIWETGGSTLDAAVEMAKLWIDQRINAETAKRRTSHIATVKEYIEALQSVTIGKHHAAMLRAHANAPDSTMTATELAKAAGYDSYETANSQYGTLARRIAEYLDIQPKLSDRREEPVWTSILADGAEEGNEQGHWRWVMHPEVAQALRKLNMA